MKKRERERERDLNKAVMELEPEQDGRDVGDRLSSISHHTGHNELSIWACV